MVDLAGYEKFKSIHNSRNSQVYRAQRQEDGQSVIIKLLNKDYPTTEQIRCYKQEYQLTRQLDAPGIIKAYSLEKWQRSYAIILEDFGGIALKQWLQLQGRLSVQEFLEVAIATTQSLGEIHSHNIIHKDINPANIILNPQTKAIKIIDFGISTQLSRENPTLKNPNVLEGTLGYISPEQTGRMNRGLDYRSDFYSLGVTFYEILTGQLPFLTEDPLELVHAHITKPAPSATETQPHIASSLAAIVQKLMAKNAEDRYQSIWGLQADLETCQRQLTQTNEILPFKIGQRDRSTRFQIPQKLYGRDTEIAQLLTAFQRVTTTGTAELMLVAGYSGIGKSALVQELYKPITASKGYFISGKFDQLQRNIPYSAVVTGFSDLMRQFLTEAEAKLEQWREKIQAALGASGQVIIDVIPEVELIIGPQPEVVELGPTESQNRFNSLFEQFIRVIGSSEHPLVIFLDDLQWADAATLKLIELMMAEPEDQYLFLIGAYRDNEVDATHALTLTLEKLCQSQATVEQMTLIPLLSGDINQLITDTLHCDRVSATSLTQLVTQKTGGNPFFINQFLTILHEEKLIYFDEHQQYWQWEIDQIYAIAISDNVVELMVRKLQKLPTTTRKILSEAACIGADFSLQLLQAVYPQSERAELYQWLLPVVQSGLVLPTSSLDADLLIETYQFLHDRVQQAAYSLLPESEKLKVHYQLGRVLLMNSDPDVLEERLFEIIDHLNEALVLATTQSEKEAIAQLNLRGGQKAKAATAYGAAANYLEIGRSILKEEGWERQYSVMLALHIEGVEVAFLNADYPTMQSLFEVLDAQSNTVLECVPAYEILINFHASQNQLARAISTGLEVVSMLGIELIESPPKPVDPNTLNDREELTEPKQLAALKIFANLFGPAYISDQEFLTKMIWTMYTICQAHGNSALASNTYGFYGFLLCATGEIDLGYAYGKLALKLAEKFDAKALMGRVRHSYHVFIQLYKEPLRDTLEPLSESMMHCIEQGDLDFGGYTSTDSTINVFLSGLPLTQVLQQQKYNVNYGLKSAKQEYAFIHNKIWAQLTENLMGGAQLPMELVGTWIDERELLPVIEEKNNITNLCRLFLMKAILSYTLSDFDASLTYIQRSRTYERAVRGTICAPIILFYHSLCLLSAYSEKAESERQEYLTQVAINQEKLKNLARNAPMNFQHKFDLVEAEQARVWGQVARAMQHYEWAIAGAKENLYLQDEGLSYERAAEFYGAQGMGKFAEVYTKEAHYCYDRWGARAKVEQLEVTYPQLLYTSVIGGGLNDIASTHSSTTPDLSNYLDITALMKASQSIASEIVLSQLLTQLINVLLEGAGAQLGFLILEIAGELRIEAGAEASGEVAMLQSLPLDFVKPDRGLPLLCPAIVNYVARTRETVVLDDACHRGNFTNQPYLQTLQVQSVLCVPLLNQGQLKGIVYLENNLATAAFSPDRLQVVKLLSSQAAISLENARFYQTLEDKVTERTQQLAAANDEIMQLNDRLKAENLRMSAELDVAQRMQEMILPRTTELTAIPELDIAGSMTPADEVGGDYYDVLVEGDVVTIAIGDVTGHGLESGLVMMMTQSMVRTLTKLRETDPVRFLNTVNAAIYDNVQRMGVDRNLSLAILSYAQGQLSLSGQHEEVLLLRADGTLEHLDTLDLGMMIGLIDDIGDFIAQQTVELQVGDGVVLYTDGVPEAKNTAGEFYGLERLCAVVQSHWHGSAEMILDTALTDFQNFIADSKVMDDITLLVLKRR